MDSRTPRGWRGVLFAGVLTGLVTVLTGALILTAVRRQAVRDAERQLLLLMSLRRSTLERGVDQLESELALWSAFGPLRESLDLYVRYFHQLGPRAGEVLQRRFVTESPYPPADRHLLLDPGDGSSYSRWHAEHQPRVTAFLQIHAYRDLYLIDADGDVVYSYRKEADFGTDLDRGPWKDTGLARAFREARDAEDPAHVAFVDFTNYEAGDGEPAFFLASPVYAGPVFKGALAARVGPEAVNRIMGFTEGMGETGETYLVGEDHLMRSDSRFTDGSDVLRLNVDTESVTAAFAGGSGVHRIRDYRGVPVLSAYGLLEQQEIRWAVIAEKDVAEVLAPTRRLRRLLFWTGAVVVFLVVLSAIPGRDRPDFLRSPDPMSSERPTGDPGGLPG